MKIALTGGPSSGKSTIADILEKIFCLTVVKVPEAATILFSGGFPRASSPYETRHQQIAIFDVQKHTEKILELKNPHKNLVCDRASLDGLAYWPGNKTDFFRGVKSSLEVELERYNWIIHLDTVDAEFYSQTLIRTESYSEADDINSKIRNIWSVHPRQIIIANTFNFHQKIAKVVKMVDMILREADIREIRIMNGRED